MGTTQNYHETGGAVVETALMMMIFVPLMMYVMFIQDAVHHLLSIQETAIASIWDFSTAPFGVNNSVSNRISKTNGSGSIDKYNQWQYIDHESAYIDVDNFESMREDDEHHNSPFVDTTWVGGQTSKDTSYSQYYNKNGSQVVCQRRNDRSFSLAMVYGGVGSFSNQFAPRGGEYVCWAKGFVLNKILPRVFMPEFIKTEVFSGQKYASGAAHSNASSSAESQADQEQNGGTDLFMFFRARGALLADSWAALKDHLDDHRDYTINTSVFPMATWSHDLAGQDQGSYFHERVLPWFQTPINVSSLTNLGLVEIFNSVKLVRILNYKTQLLTQNLADPFGLPPPELLWLTATYSHVGRSFNVNEYRYKTQLDVFGAEQFTTSSREYLRKARSERTEFYLGLERE